MSRYLDNVYNKRLSIQLKSKQNLSHKPRYCFLDTNVRDVTSINPMSDITSQFLALYFNLLGTPIQAGNLQGM